MSLSYTVSRSSRKSIAIVVTRNAEVEVRAPLRMSKKAIDEFVCSKLSWIEKNLAEQRQQLEQQGGGNVNYGEKVLFFGEEKTVTAAAVKSAVLADSTVLLEGGLTPDEIKAQLSRLYKSEAVQYIKPRVAELSRLTGLFPSSVSITAAKTRWGSCAADRLSFSQFLIMANRQAIDYVIIHELSHTVHHDHSKSFWELVGSFCPEHKVLRASLKPVGQKLNREFR